MERGFLAFFDAATLWTSRIARYFILPVVAVMVYEVLARFVFRHPTSWAHELAMMFFGAHLILAGSYCLLTGTHIKIDILWGRLSERGRAIADLVTSILFFIFAGLFVRYSAVFAWRSIQIWEVEVGPFNPPLWPFKTTLFIAAVLLIFQGLAKFIRDLRIATGRGQK